MNVNQQTRSRLPWLASIGVIVILLGTLSAGGMSTRNSSQTAGGNLPTVHLNSSLSQDESVQQTAVSNNVLSCGDYNTIYGANYNQLLDSSFSFMTATTTRLPGQNQALLNFQYNAAAAQAYALYTGAIKAQNCTPSIAAPTPLTPASPPSSTIDPSTLGTDIPTVCAYPLALQMTASYYQQYVENMQNEMSNFTNFINNLEPNDGSISPRLQSGAISVQEQFHANVTNLNSTFSTELGNIGC